MAIPRLMQAAAIDRLWHHRVLSIPAFTMTESGGSCSVSLEERDAQHSQSLPLQGVPSVD